MSDAQTLCCPQCGAPAAANAVRCAYCKAQLQTVACPSCFGLMFLGAKFCSRCGARAASVLPQHVAAGCPRCKKAMLSHALGGCVLDQCGACGGVWLDAADFARVREDKDAQAAFVGPGAPSAVKTLDPSAEPLVYLPCPRCAVLMNRVNFAGSSGIVLDTCQKHGTWFDKDKLPAVVEFIRAGGLDEARRRGLAELRAETGRLDGQPALPDELDALRVGPDADGLTQTLAGRVLRSLLP